MKILFCNITYLNYYDGRIAGELTPKTGGRWVQENEDAHEKWNFLNMDGICYGYVQGNSDFMHIERLENTSRQEAYADDVLIVWCASHPEKEKGTVIVGWYEHARAHRILQETVVTPISGLERDYWFETEAENAYLLPKEHRTFEIGRSSKTGAGTGFGQQNYWFADSEYAKENIIPNVLAFIENHRRYRINVLTSAFDCPTPCLPMTAQEESHYESLEDDLHLERLPFAYRMFEENPTADNAFAIGICLRGCFQYRKAIKWYEKVVALDEADDSSRGTLAYLYQQCGQFEQSISCAKSLLNCKSAIEDEDFREEVYSMLADGYHWSGNPEEANYWQMKIIEESKNQELITYTKEVMASWKN